VRLASFGQQVVNDELAKLFERKTPLTDNIEVQLYLDEAYQTTYGIHNHNLHASSPFDLVGFHPVEDIWSSSLKRSYIRRFRLNSVGKHFNISILEFFKLTKVEADELLDQAVEANKATSRTADSIEAQLSKELNKMGGE
jgi:hypothetical protein